MLRLVPWLGINGQNLVSVSYSNYKKPLLEGKLTARISFPRAASALSFFDFLFDHIMIVESTTT